MVPAPWPRFWTSVVLTDGGRLTTAFVSAAPAAWAWAQLCADTAEDRLCSSLARLLL
jgi:hypothetical protein